MDEKQNAGKKCQKTKIEKLDCACVQVLREPSQQEKQFDTSVNSQERARSLGGRGVEREMYIDDLPQNTHYKMGKLCVRRGIITHCFGRKETCMIGVL